MLTQISSFKTSVLNQLTGGSIPNSKPVTTPQEPADDQRPVYPQDSYSRDESKAFVAPQLAKMVPRFGHTITNDYVVEHRPRVPVNAYAVSKTLRAHVLRDLAKREQDDPSNLKYALNADQAFDPIDEAALGDNFVLLDRDVDTIIKSQAGSAAVNALMMTRLMNGTGKRFISQDGSIALGPSLMVSGGKNHDEQINRELTNEYLRDKEALIMLATGETDRAKVNRDLTNLQILNALQSLHYGKKGLVDAILVGKDKVLTRHNLEEFYKDEGFSQKQVAEFNSRAGNVDRIPAKFLLTLKKFAPDSPVAPKLMRHENRPKHYFTFEDQLQSAVSGTNNQQMKALDQVAANHLQVLVRPLQDTKFKMIPKIPFLNTPIGAFPDVPAQYQIRGAVPGQGIIYDDLITLNDAFDDETGEQIRGALEALEEKKQRQDDPSHIKILINSPGGSALTGQELRSAISELSPKVKVDVIAQGMAASCGSYFLASATGNRFSTPLARIMVHQSRMNPQINLHSYGNQMADSNNSFTDDYVALIAKASGRDLDAVRRDFRQDTWLNPLEAMFYGKKGLLDGVLVTADKAITRENVRQYLQTDPDVRAYLNEKFPNSKQDKVSAYLNNRLRKLREPNRIHDPKEWEATNARDPFDNPIKTIMAVARLAKPIKDIPKLQGSATRPQNVMDQFVIGRQPMFSWDFPESIDEDSEKEGLSRKASPEKQAPRQQPALPQPSGRLLNYPGYWIQPNKPG
jgi:ATP-dependent Clp protease protease subunit